MIHLITTGTISSISGGSIYNAQMLSYLNLLGYKTTTHFIQPHLSSPSLEALDKATKIIRHIESADIILLDSIVISELFNEYPRLFEQRKFIGLIHLPKSLNPIFAQNLTEIKKDAKAFKSLHKIIATSEYSYELITEKFKLNENKILVIKPGVGQVVEKEKYSDFPSRFLCVSNFVKGKNIKGIIESLANLKESDWKLEIYGNQEIDKSCVRAVRGAIHKLDLESQVKISTPLAYPEMLRKYHNFDLLINASKFETFGMNIAEATNAGLPWLSTDVGIVTKLKRLGVGKIFDNEITLENLLHHLRQNNKAYSQLCHRARIYKNYFNDWNHSANQFIKMLKNFNS